MQAGIERDRHSFRAGSAPSTTGTKLPLSHKDSPEARVLYHNGLLFRFADVYELSGIPPNMVGGQISDVQSLGVASS